MNIKSFHTSNKFADCFIKSIIMNILILKKEKHHSFHYKMLQNLLIRIY